VLADVGQARLGVDEDDTLGTLAEGEDTGHLTDGAGAPDGDLVILVDRGVLGGVVGCCKNIGKVERCDELARADVFGIDSNLPFSSGTPSGISKRFTSPRGTRTYSA
jgi:hypothetical protein